MKRLSAVIAILTMISVPLVADASCKDIEISCAKAYHLDLASCSKNYSGSQYKDCQIRAEVQFNYCYNSSGCK